jgi:putative transposase
MHGTRAHAVRPYHWEAKAMPYDPEKHHRQTIRLPEYDYRQVGAYFITLCAHQHVPLFGEIVDGEMHLNDYGHIVLDEWMETAIIRPGVFLDDFIVMPNHFHAIVLLSSSVGAHSRAPSAGGTSLSRVPKSLGSLVAGFKAIVTKRINLRRAAPGTSVWQRSYYEHIIRDDDGLQRIRQYIVANPAMWESDSENTNRRGPV